MLVPLCLIDNTCITVCDIFILLRYCRRELWEGNGVVVDKMSKFIF